MATLANTCERCRKPFRAALSPGAGACPHCGGMVWKVESEQSIFNACIFCGCKHFYRQKNFNPVFGLLLIGVGAGLVPWTYGLSLPALFLADLWLRRRISDMAVCYRCRAEFRGLSLPASVLNFDHHVAAMFEEGYTS